MPSRHKPAHRSAAPKTGTQNKIPQTEDDSSVR